MSIGETLARARREAGLSIAEISSRTRLRLSVIYDIEHDDFSACGGDRHARDNIAAIAGALGVDSGPLIEAYAAAGRPAGWITATGSSESAQAMQEPEAFIPQREPEEFTPPQVPEPVTPSQEREAFTPAPQPEPPTPPQGLPAFIPRQEPEPFTPPQEPEPLTAPLEPPAFTPRQQPEPVTPQPEPVTPQQEPERAATDGDTQPITIGQPSEPLTPGEPASPPMIGSSPSPPAETAIPPTPSWPIQPRPSWPVEPRPSWLAQLSPVDRRQFIWIALGGALIVIAALGGILLIIGASGQATPHTVVAGQHHGASHPARIKPPPGHSASSPRPTPRTSSARGRPVQALVPASIKAFGPSGTGQGDSPQLAHQALAGKSGAPWHSAWYATAHFGNLQSGTGLLLDMGRPVTITAARITLGNSRGADLALRIGNSPILASLPPVTHANGVGGVVGLKTAPTRGRYVLVWFTRLPPDQAGTFQVSVYNIKLRGHR